MSDYQPTTSQTNTPSSIGYANPKVLEKKLQQQDDWAKLAEKQAAINAQLSQQEKLQKQLKKEDLEKNLFVMIQQKQSNKKHFDYNQRVKDYTEVKAVQEEYENQLRRAREDRNDVKKTLANELVREIHLKEQERRRKLDNDKQVESKIISDALDDLRKDSMMKIQKKNTINHVFNSHLQERQEEKRRRYEQDQYEKEMERKHVNRMTYMEQNRMGAHMMHFQNFFEKQKKMGEIYMSTVANDQKEREQQVNAYITRGVQNDNRKADEEDAQRRLKKDHQTRSLSENVQIQKQEKDQQQREKRNSKKSQGEIAVIDNYYHQDYDKKVKQFKASQAHIYKNALDDQIREAGIRKIKASHEIPEDQKRMHFNHAENTLAKINERTNNNIPVKARPLENSSPFLDGPADLSPVNYGHHRKGNLSLNASSVVDLTLSLWHDTFLPLLNMEPAANFNSCWKMRVCVPCMGCTAVETILLFNQTIKFNENLDPCDEKIKKGFWVKFEALRDQKKC